ncbi:hypothetical protein ANCCEY_14638 [Ancylostoma ceylanicum]|uniref:Uncharacterized protein n=1 Tax=Ancylostoma ceylanicum TaxID=53326 RepID=A0A0D6L9D7_9BILA|nr:hypothetical protein ANCCEY_14638 [Ancylostoma ceylanicum]
MRFETSPGVTVTNLHRRSGQDETAYAAFLEKSKSTHALGRPGDPREVAEAILFLASDKSSFTTGQLLRFPGVTYYCMSKAALDQFIKCLALEMAPHGVRVNAVNKLLH